MSQKVVNLCSTVFVHYSGGCYVTIGVNTQTDRKENIEYTISSEYTIVHYTIVQTIWYVYYGIRSITSYSMVYCGIVHDCSM